MKLSNFKLEEICKYDSDGDTSSLHETESFDYWNLLGDKYTTDDTLTDKKAKNLLEAISPDADKDDENEYLKMLVNLSKRNYEAFLIVLYLWRALRESYIFKRGGKYFKCKYSIGKFAWKDFVLMDIYVVYCCNEEVPVAIKIQKDNRLKDNDIQGGDIISRKEKINLNSKDAEAISHVLKAIYDFSIFSGEVVYDDNPKMASMIKFLESSLEGDMIKYDKDGKRGHDVVLSDIGGLSEEEKHNYVKRMARELPDIEEIKDQINSNPDDSTKEDVVFSNPPEKRGPLKNYTI